MFPFLAQLDTVNGQTVKDVFLVLMALLAVAGTIYGFVGNKTRTIDPQPLEVRGAAEFVPRKDFEHLRDENKREHEMLFAKIGGVSRGAEANLQTMRQEIHGMELRLNTANEERSSKLHDRINEVLEAVSELRGRCDSCHPDHKA